jgi:thiol-disulfide isomerase/thioredoxin
MVIGILLPIINLFSQTSSAIWPLSIGDTVPDITFNNIINYKSSTAKFSDFKKPVILDFFSTWCSPCIKALPHLDSLQRRFSDSIQILVVTNEPPEKIQSFLQANAIGKRISLPFITRDSCLQLYFPHKLIPHEVVMDKKHIVKAITYPEYINATVINALFTGREFQYYSKNDVPKFNRDQPLYKNVNIDSCMISNSTLTRYIEGLGGQTGYLISKDSLNKRIYYINRPLISLYEHAADFPEGSNRIILEVKDSSKYIQYPNHWIAWASKNAYCYEISVPITTPEEMIDNYMLQDLNRYLHMNVHKEKRLIKCWALVYAKQEKGLVARSILPRSNVQSDKEDSLKIDNKPISYLIEVLNNQRIDRQPSHPIVLDETGYVGNVNWVLHGDNIQNLPGTARELHRYGFDIIPVERELEMLIITENDYRQ